MKANPVRASRSSGIVKKDIREPKALCEAYDYPKPVPFSRGMRVDLAGATFLFISGTASVDERGRSAHPGDLAAQARRTFANIRALLEAEGAGWKDVVRTTVYLKNMDQYEQFNGARWEFYRAEKLDPLPASTCVEARLCRDEFLVEIEALAVVPRGSKRGRNRTPTRRRP